MYVSKGPNGHLKLVLFSVYEAYFESYALTDPFGELLGKMPNYGGTAIDAYPRLTVSVCVS